MQSDNLPLLQRVFDSAELLSRPNINTLGRYLPVQLTPRQQKVYQQFHAGQPVF